ncbi:uncharacterized protein LOC144004290 [Festucalex cinctus]
MGLIQNQNSTLGFSDLVVSRWESMPQTSYENNVVIVLGALTFVLQLCLALLVMRRCMNLDNKIREAVEHPQTLQKLQMDPSPYQQDVSRQIPYQPYDSLSSVAVEGCYPTATATNCLFGPSIPWDLVQR